MRELRILSLFVILALALSACAPAASTPAAPSSGGAAITSATPTAGSAATSAAPTAGSAASTSAAPTVGGAASTSVAPATATTTASTAPAAGADGGPVKIGSKNFTEELLLGEMYAQLLESVGVKVERKLNLAGTQVAHEALLKGEIDIYPEYTGTGYQTILGIQDGQKDPQKVYQSVADQYKQKWNLTWLQPAPMNDTNAIAVTQDAATKYNLKTLSDLSKAAPNLRFAAVPDCLQRPDCLPGLQRLYGGFQFKDVKTYDPGLKYKAIQDGQADAVVAFSTDGQITAFNLVLMEDDKGLFPPYQVAPVVRADVLAKYPQIKDQLDKLAPLITNEVISGLNWKVDGDKQEYTTVATDFLKSKGLIK